MHAPSDVHSPFPFPRQGLLVTNCHHGVVGAWKVSALHPTFPELQVHLSLKTVLDAHNLHGSAMEGQPMQLDP